MYTKPRNGDFVTDGLIRGFVIGTGGTKDRHQHKGFNALCR